MVSGFPISLTGLQVGTSFYISPEVAHVAKESDTYDAKADCFSLGMVAFELWHPFGTGMERVRLMQRLQLDSELPEAFEAQHPEVSHGLDRGWGYLAFTCLLVY